MCLGASLRGLQPEVAFPQDYHGDCTRLIFVSHSMHSSNALKKLAQRGLVLLKLSTRQERGMALCVLEGVWAGWEVEKAGNPLFLILQTSESLSFSVGTWLVNRRIICGLFLAPFSPPQWEYIPLFSHCLLFLPLSCGKLLSSPSWLCLVFGSWLFFHIRHVLQFASNSCGIFPKNAYFPPHKGNTYTQ